MGNPFFERNAMKLLGIALQNAGHTKEALAIHNSRLTGDFENSRSCMAFCYSKLGRDEDSQESMNTGVKIRREIYARKVASLGEAHEESIAAAHSLAITLANLHHRLKDSQSEAKALLNDYMPLAARIHGPNHEMTMRFRGAYAYVLWDDPAHTLDDCLESVAIYEDIERFYLRQLGENYPETLNVRRELEAAREQLARLREENDKATMMAVALVAALAFLAGRRYLRG